MRRFAALVAVFLFALTFPGHAAGEPMPDVWSMQETARGVIFAPCGIFPDILFDGGTDDDPDYDWVAFFEEKDDLSKKPHPLIVIYVPELEIEMVYVDINRDGKVDRSGPPDQEGFHNLCEALGRGPRA